MGAIVQKNNPQTISLNSKFNITSKNKPTVVLPPIKSNVNQNANQNMSKMKYKLGFDKRKDHKNKRIFLTGGIIEDN